MITSVFTYGTLMIPSIMRRVTGKKYSGNKAWLKDYQRFKLNNEIYPGIIEFPGATIEGIVYMKVSEDSLELLDRFEGNLYERRQVIVRTLEKEQVHAYTYVIRDDKKNVLSSNPWEKCRFLWNHYEEFMKNYCGFQNIK